MPRGPVACAQQRAQRSALGALIRGLRRAFSAVPYSAYEKYASVVPASEGSASLPVSAPSPCLEQQGWPASAACPPEFGALGQGP